MGGKCPTHGLQGDIVSLGLIKAVLKFFQHQEREREIEIEIERHHGYLQDVSGSALYGSAGSDLSSEG